MPSRSEGKVSRILTVLIALVVTLSTIGCAAKTTASPILLSTGMLHNPPANGSCRVEITAEVRGSSTTKVSLRWFVSNGPAMRFMEQGSKFFYNVPQSGEASSIIVVAQDLGDSDRIPEVRLHRVTCPS